MKSINKQSCFNEDKIYHRAIANIPSCIEGINEIETLIVDHDSKDNTMLVARGLSVHHIILNSENTGLPKIFRRGIIECLRTGIDMFETTDSIVA